LFDLVFPACSCTSISFYFLADNRASELTKEGMLKGIEQAAAFILFLSIGVLQRPYCQMEIRHAMALKKPIVLLHEVSFANAHALLLISWFTPPPGAERRTLRRLRLPHRPPGSAA
jgi:hypothetical protein